VSFGPAKGVGFEAFCKLVKRLTYRTRLSAGKEVVVELPLKFYNVPNYAIVLQEKS